jgi:predicted phosphoribosyltransferase
MLAAVKELREQHPQKIMIAVPVAPQSTADRLKIVVDDFVAIKTPSGYDFLGSVGAYYNKFEQVEDEKVINILTNYSYI